MKGFLLALLIATAFVVGFLFCMTRAANAQPPKKYHGRQTAAVVIDANGHLVGQAWGEGLGNTTELAIRKLPDGTTVALPVSVQGFVDEATTGSFGGLSLWYQTTDCSGPGEIALGGGFDPRTGQQLAIVPIIQETTDGGGLGTYVFNNTVFYATQPIELTTFNSQAFCVDPAACPNDPAGGGCQPLPPQTFMAGPMTSFDLGSLNLTAPFSVQQ